MNEGTWLGHVTEHVALEIQRTAGHELTRGKTRSTGERGVYNVIYGYLDDTVGTEAGKLAVRLVNHLVQPEPDFDFTEEHEAFLRMCQRVAFGPSTQAILDEAITRDIPWQRLNSGSLVQLGQGVHQHRIRATMTSITGSLAVDIASDKELTNRLLAAAGLPVPSAEVVRTADGAVQMARRIGYPVVLKPLDGNHGRGVVINLNTPEEVRAAFDVAESESRRGTVIVESFIVGKDYRVLVVGGNMIAIAERVPAHVIGDGNHTVAELVDITNADPRRGVGHEKVLTRIEVNRGGCRTGCLPGLLDGRGAAGRQAGAARADRQHVDRRHLDRPHLRGAPGQRRHRRGGGRVVGLDIAGIDFLCPDITQPVREAGGAICEVNAAPGFRMHTHPTIGDPQYVAKPVVDLMFPPGAPSRIPIVAVTGTNGKTTTSRMIGHIFKGIGRKVGMTSTDGVVIDERLVIKLRRVRSAQRPDGAAEPAGRLRGVRGRPRRHPARRSRLRPQRRRRRAERRAGPPGAARRRHRRAARQGETGGGGGGAEERLRGAERRRPAGPRHAAGLLRRDRLVLHQAEQPDDRGPLPARRQGGHPREGRARGPDPAGARPPPDAAGLHPPAARHVRRQGDVQRAERDGRRRCGLLCGRTPARHPFRTAQFHPVVLLGTGPDEPDRGARGQGHRRLLPQRPGDGGTRIGFVDRFFDDSPAWERPQRIGVIATAGDRRDQDMRDLGYEAAKHFDRIIVREDLRTRGRKVGDDRGSDRRGRPARDRGIVPAQGGRGRAGRDRRHQGRVSPGPTPATWSCCASTARRRSGTSCRPSATARSSAARRTDPDPAARPSVR